jgi:hypothetical protein
MRIPSFLVVIPLLLTGGCQSTPHVQAPAPSPPAPTRPATVPPSIPRDVYYQKILGLLIGSAIGDAMGAPTEMWSRRDIQLDYGFVDDLQSMVRAPSAEGTWKNNLPAGGTTDDTRWKALAINFLLEQPRDQVTATAFAEHIVIRYQSRIADLKATTGFDPKPYEQTLMKMAWLQEWALVAQPYAQNKLPDYAQALSKFYGGEMTCAGMLYAPMLGAVHPADPATAYALAYDLGIFDLGYARDMTGLVSAMTAAAFASDATGDSISRVNRTVDPEAYFESRLIGRSAYRFYQHARRIVADARAFQPAIDQPAAVIPPAFTHLIPEDYAKLKFVFDELDKANEDVAFHPGEIYLILLTAMLYSDFEFEPTMSFIVNYGRDNDTIAAIAGAILGAYLGADQLPPAMSAQVLEVNETQLGISLETLAHQMTDWMYSLR